MKKTTNEIDIFGHQCFETATCNLSSFKLNFRAKVLERQFDSDRKR